MIQYEFSLARMITGTPLLHVSQPKQCNLSFSRANSNLGYTKLNWSLERRLIVLDANAKNPDQLYQHIADLQEIDKLECR